MRVNPADSGAIEFAFIDSHSVTTIWSFTATRSPGGSSTVLAAYGLAASSARGAVSDQREHLIDIMDIDRPLLGHGDPLHGTICGSRAPEGHVRAAGLPGDEAAGEQEAFEILEAAVASGGYDPLI
ncbi:MAG: hypothetical protein ACLPYS_19065 [Vulcanimicrobiaceae bacterium]